MEKSISAIYENGLLRPLEPLHLQERQQVSLTIDEPKVTLSGDQDLLDQDFLRSLAGEELPEVTLEEVRAALAKVPETMTATFVAEREERF